MRVFIQVLAEAIGRRADRSWALPVSLALVSMGPLTLQEKELLIEAIATAK